ncbi:MAG: tRNA (adenosine(37)-N6)-threonylcarbamoyltransferase complex ATPase subunit type 1 TsaE [Chitinophagaceae bacterium]|nr:tRNA (adenosine(37)-N6)-threonylcarbamoyltransferase complex ATPase subunit type 1 TsaE [Chitinophagaceae bacterium]
MAEHELTVDLDDIHSAAKEFLRLTKGGKVFTFSGELGAGKTTFIAALCAESGVKDVVSSPTFSIIQQYDSRDGTIFHIDLYRIRDEEEAINAGIEDCILSGDVCVIEWPERAPGILPPDTVRCLFEIESEKRRKLKVFLPEHSN